DVVHESLGFVDEGLDVYRGDLKIRDDAVGRIIHRVVFDQFSDRAFAIGDAFRDRPYVADSNAEGVRVLFDEIGNRAKQRREVFRLESFGQTFDAIRHAFQFDHQGAEVWLFNGRQLRVFMSIGRAGSSEVDTDVILSEQAGKSDRSLAVSFDGDAF